jgi:hypothetical protein
MGPKRWKGRRGRAEERHRAVAARPPCLANAVRWLCALCGREARGFGIMLEGPWSANHSAGFCSMQCMDAGGDRVDRRTGVIDKSRMESQAIKDARRCFAEVLTEMGLLAPFHDRGAAEIDRIIEACVDGFQNSMRRQAAAHDPFDDPIPF